MGTLEWIKKRKKEKSEKYGEAAMDSRKRRGLPQEYNEPKKKTQSIVQKQQEMTLERAPGKSPNIQKTIYGTEFDVNLPIVNTDFQSKKDYEQARRMQDLTSSSGLLPSQEREEARKREQEITGQSIETAREIPMQNPKETAAMLEEAGFAEPGPLFEVSAATGLATAATDLFEKIKGGTATPEEIAYARQKYNLNELDFEIIKSGKAQVNSLSQWSEGIPLVGKLRFRGVGFSLGVSDLVGASPTKKADDFMDNLDSLKGNIDTWADGALANPSLAASYSGLIKDAEQEVLILESKIKLMTIQSGVLQSEPERVNDIEARITDIKSKIQIKRNSLILAGLY